MATVSNLDQSAFSKATLFALLEQSTSGVFLWDASTDRVLWSSKLESALGYPSRPDAAYIDFADLLHPDDRHAMQDAVERTRRGRGEYEMMIRLRSQSGDYKEFQVFGTWLTEASSSETLVGFVIDHTDLNEARTEAERTKQLLENFFETAPAAVYLKDNKYRHKYGNAMAARVAGCTREDFLNKTTMELFGAESAANLAAVDDRVLQERETISWQGQATSATGESFFLHDTKFPVTDPKTGEVMVGGFGIDISKQHEAEMQLAQSRKLEALGQLVAGIAHDFNNSLMVMQSSLELLKRSQTMESVTDFVGELSAGIERGARLTEQLLAFGRQAVLKNEVIALTDVLASMEGMLRSTTPENIALEFELHEGAQAIKADRSQVENIVLNLVLNSVDAMPDGGTLTIGTRMASTRGVDIGWQPQKEEASDVLLYVSDTGQGIPPSLMERVFDPFFTTKDVGKGTGMGLAMIEGLMTQLGGSVSIQSSVGAGTTVELLFPVTIEAVDERKAPSEVSCDGFGDEILLVEDNASVLRLLAKQLRDQGFEVLEATNGAEAIAKLDTNTSISMVISDIVMPGDIQGIELAKTIRAKRPGLPIILMSGYPLDNDTQSENRQYFDAGLMKPVRAQELLRTVLDLHNGPRLAAHR